MKYRVPDPDIAAFTMWDDDPIMDLVNQADTLSKLVSEPDETLVIGLDADWGSGKTTFLKRWQKLELAKDPKKHHIIFFDAFEHDYLDDPFLALTSKILEGQESPASTKIKEIAAELLSSSVRVLANFVPIAGAVHDLALDATKLFQQEDSQREAMTNFRSALGDFAKGEGRLVIIIDELDRCKPDFALNVLEIIKHCFQVPNVYFILGVNADALCDIIKTRYGNGADGRRYLDKFITVWIAHRPKSRMGNQQIICNYLVDTFKAMDGEYRGLPLYIMECAKLVFKKGNSGSFRDVNRLLIDTAFAPNFNLVQQNEEAWFPAFFLAILFVMRRLNNDLYLAIRNPRLHKKDLAQQVITWLRLEDEPSEKFNLSLWRATLYYLNYEAYYAEVLKGRSGISWEHHSQETGIYNRLEEEVFSIMETITVPPTP